MIIKEDKNEINVSIVGDYYTGKTTIFNSIFGKNLEKDETTISIERRKKVIEINEIKYTLNIYDTPGYDYKIYEKLIAIKYSDIIILVYNTNQFSTFEEIKYLFDDDKQKGNYQYQIWLNIYQEKIRGPENNNKVFGLLGNKFNDKDSFNDAQEEEIKKFSNSIDAKTTKMYKGEFINEFLEELLVLYLHKNELCNHKYINY